ncbi:MAG: multifunctional CCA tRNA nucleotidyl transferase/2'3'-cyclic phosphodiesterase/2'nucleotidase/phosphatase [Steroidobacteraceae bacterium]
MQVYLVGGAVRDELLGRAVTERDWVVVGGTPADMERAGYRPVGREFPVFLHPQTNEEYALARLERKTGPGYRGFTMQFSPEVTLEEDLLRRDLTINAMARSPEGTLIDPYGGREDLHERQLRHVSAAFVEDPVRVLRVARFAARFAELGFRVAPETYSLMRAMVANGEVAALVPERVWQELERALREPSPEVFFDTLQDCGALAVLLPELRWEAADRDALRAVVPLSGDTSVRFAALGAGSAEAGLAALCERLRAPNPHRELALLCLRLQQRIAAASALDGAGLLELLESADAVRRPERFERLLCACRARGTAPDTASLLRAAVAAAAAVALPRERMAQLNGPAIAAALRAARTEQLTRLQSERRRS